MAHDIMMVGGKAQIATLGTAWHGLNDHSIVDPYDLDTALVISGCDARSDVIVCDAWAAFPAELGLGKGACAPADVARLIVRKIDGRIFGACKGLYEPIQFSQAFEPLRALLASKRVSLECMARLGDGREAFACVKIAESELAPGDAIQVFLIATLAHDGSGSLRFYRTAVRVVCQNTLNFSKADARDEVVIRHTPEALAKIDAFSSALSSTEGSIGANLAAWSAMARTRVSDATRDAYFAALVPDREPTAGERAKANVVQARATLVSLYEQGAGAQLRSAAGTCWGLYNAGTAYASHVQRARADAESRFRSLTEGVGADFIARAESLALEIVAGRDISQQAHASV